MINQITTHQKGILVVTSVIRLKLLKANVLVTPPNKTVIWQKSYHKKTYMVR
jgi:hypothetical protein